MQRQHGVLVVVCRQMEKFGRTESNKRRRYIPTDKTEVLRKEYIVCLFIAMRLRQEIGNIAIVGKGKLSHL